MTEERMQELDQMLDQMLDGVEDTPPVPKPPMLKVVVYFSYTRKDGSTGVSRIFIDGMTTLRTTDQILAVEKHIMDQNGGELISVLITHWYPLEG